MGNACNFAQDDEEMHFENQVSLNSLNIKVWYAYNNLIIFLLEQICC